MYGPARSLVLLAYEETMHGVIYHWIDRGWATFEKSKASSAIFVDAALLRNHPLKQFLIFLFDLALLNFALNLRSELARGDNPGIRPQAAVEAMIAEAESPPLPTSEFNLWKNEGFYVMVLEDKLRTPQSVRESEFLDLRDRVKVRTKMASALERADLSAEEVESVRLSAVASRGRFDARFLEKLQRVERALGPERFRAELWRRANAEGWAGSR